MKYFAILKDSFYETIDYKILYVMMALSLVLAIICGSFLFFRLPVDTVLTKNLDDHFVVSDVSTEGESWLTPRGTYRLALTPKRAEGLSHRLHNEIDLRREIREEVRKSIRNKDYKPDLTRLEQEKHPVPQSAEEWSGLVRDYLAATPGFVDAEVLDTRLDAEGRVSNVEARVVLNWTDVPDSHQIGYLFGYIRRDIRGQNVGLVLSGIQFFLIDWIAGLAGMIVAVIVTAGFIPNMLRKGTIDLLLVKPISRPSLLVYKYLGGLAFILINALFLISVTWIVFGFTTGIWSPWYLASILSLTFYFAILYSFSVYVGVTTRSTLATILVTVGLWIFLGLVNIGYGWSHPDAATAEIMPWTKEIPAPVIKGVDVMHLILPKPGDLSVLNKSLLMRANGSEEMLWQSEEMLSKFSWTETLLTSTAFIVVMLGLACWRFSRKDY